MKRYRIYYRDLDPGSPTFRMTVKAHDREDAEEIFWMTGPDTDWIIEKIERAKPKQENQP